MKAFVKTPASSQTLNTNIDVPGDGWCLFYAILLPAFINVLHDDQKFEALFKKIHPHEGYKRRCDEWKRLLQQYLQGGCQKEFLEENDGLLDIVAISFRARLYTALNSPAFAPFAQEVQDSETLANEIARLKEREKPKNSGGWSGQFVIQAAAELLEQKIVVHQKGMDTQTHSPDDGEWKPVTNKNTPTIELERVGNHYQYRKNFILNKQELQKRSLQSDKPANSQQTAEQKLHAGAKNQDVQGRYTAKNLNPKELLLDTDLKKLCTIFGLRKDPSKPDVLIIDFESFDDEFNFLLADHIKEGKILKGLLVNMGENHWVSIACEIVYNSDCAIETINLTLYDDYYSPEIKEEVRKSLEAILEKNSNLVSCEKKVAIGPSLASQTDGWSCGYRALHRVLSDIRREKTSNNTELNQFLEQDINKSNILNEHVYSLLLNNIKDVNKEEVSTELSRLFPRVSPDKKLSNLITAKKSEAKKQVTQPQQPSLQSNQLEPSTQDAVSPRDRVKFTKNIIGNNTSTPNIKKPIPQPQPVPAQIDKPQAVKKDTANFKGAFETVKNNFKDTFGWTEKTQPLDPKKQMDIKEPAKTVTLMNNKGGEITLSEKAPKDLALNYSSENKESKTMMEAALKELLKKDKSMIFKVDPSSVATLQILRDLGVPEKQIDKSGGKTNVGQQVPSNFSDSFNSLFKTQKSFEKPIEDLSTETEDGLSIENERVSFS